MLHTAILFKYPKKFITGFSYYYPISEELLATYEKLWDWKLVSRNTTISWNASLLEKFKEKWDWHELSQNRSIPFSATLLTQFEEKWIWSRFASNASVMNDPALLALCLQYWTEEDQEDIFSPYLFKEKEIEEKNRPWVEALFESAPLLNWDYFSSYADFPWSTAFIHKHADKWNWENLSNNKGIPWSKDLIATYVDRWDWWNLSYSLPWNLEWMETFQQYLNWETLLSNKSIQWTADILVAFTDQICWFLPEIHQGDVIGDIIDMYNKSSFTWTPELYEKCNTVIETYFMRVIEEEKDLLDYSGYTILEENEHWTAQQNSRNWSEAYIKMLIDLSHQFPDKCFINWFSVGSQLKYWDEWSEETLAYCLSKIPISSLARNPHFPWHKYPTVISQLKAPSKEVLENLARNANFLWKDHPDLLNQLRQYSKKWWGWEYLSSNKGFQLTEALIDHYIDKWNWKSLSANPNLTPTLIKKYKEHWNWYTLIEKHDLSLEAIETYTGNTDVWWRLREGYFNPFRNQDDFAYFLQAPKKEAINNGISNNELEAFLLQVIDKPAIAYRQEFENALHKQNFDDLCPAVTHSNYHALLIEYQKELLSHKWPNSFIKKLAKKATELAQFKHYARSAELLTLCLQIEPSDKRCDLELYGNALYMLRKIKNEDFKQLVPNVTRDTCYDLFIAYQEEVLSYKWQASFVESLANKALEWLEQKEYTTAIRLFTLCLKIETRDKVADLSIYCNALYVLQNDNTGLPVNKALNEEFLEKCLPFGPENPAIYFNAACLYAEMKQWNEVASCIQAARRYQFTGYDSMMREIKQAPIFAEFVNSDLFKS